VTSMDRRNFVHTTGAAVGAAALAPAILSGRGDQRVRLGIVGVGGRGTSLLELILRRADTDVTAISDIDPAALARAVDLVEQAGRRRPAGYHESEHDYEQLVLRDDVDAVIIATPWRWHAPMAVAAMRAGKRPGVEVPAAVTLAECWDLVNTSEATGVPCMLLENVCYRRDVAAVFRMVREGLFGELVHCRCGYQHDLREIKFHPGAEFGPGAEGEARWRTLHSVKRNGDLYPTHGIGPMATCLGVNAGNRFTVLTSMATKSRGLHQYAVARGGPAHPSARVTFALGDVVTTLIQCAGGETVVVTHDTNLPRPYSLGFRVQGTRGIWMDDGDVIYLEGVSERAHQWEPWAPYQERFDHPLWTRWAERATGAGHGGMDFFVVHAFVESVKRRVPPPIDVYDAAAWSAISELSERSVAEGGEPQAFPDFTRGRWVTRAPAFGLSDAF